MICGWKIISRRNWTFQFSWQSRIHFGDIPYTWRKGPGDLGYKRMKKVFTIRFQMAFRWLSWSWRKTGAIPVRKNKLISGDEDVTFLGDNEWLCIPKKTRNQALHYLIFGHRHLPMKVPVGENASMWIWVTGLRILHTEFFDGDNFEIKSIITRSFHDLQHLVAGLIF
jgi:hypothetical protein